MNMRCSPSWRETIGLIDAILEQQNTFATITSVNRYGQTTTGKRYIFDTDYQEDATHETIVIAEAQIAIQSMGYDEFTGSWNQIYYRPAYSYAQCAGGIAILKSVISRTGELTIPVVRQGQASLSPESVITDIHRIMTKDLISTLDQ